MDSITEYMKEINDTEYMKYYSSNNMFMVDSIKTDEYKMLLIYGMFIRNSLSENSKNYLSYEDGEKILQAANVMNSKEESKRIMNKLGMFDLISPKFIGLELEGFIFSYPFTSSILVSPKL